MLDIAQQNLQAAEGLPGAELKDDAVLLAKLEEWTRCVHRYNADARTRLGIRRRWSDTDNFVAMATMLKHPKCLNIQYQPSAIGNYNFRDSRDDFLHGVLTRRSGTCASLPVLFVAIGRRLGYPMHLALAKRHVFCVWQHNDGSFSALEGSCPGGGGVYPVSHYRTFPHSLTDEELATRRYLRPLLPNEEEALFLEFRGHCLTDNQLFDDAARAYLKAGEASPAWSMWREHLAILALRRKHVRKFEINWRLSHVIQSHSRTISRAGSQSLGTVQ